MVRQTPEADNTCALYSICTVLYCHLQLRKWCEYFLHHRQHDPSVLARQKLIWNKSECGLYLRTSANQRLVRQWDKQLLPQCPCWVTDWLTAEAVHVCPVTQCVCKWAVSAVGPQQRSELLQKVGHEAAGRADLVAVQAPLAADSDLLERVLQLRSLHRLPRTHHPGPEVPDPVHPAADHLGLLLSAVLPVGGQQHGRTLQEDVSIVRPLVCWRIRDSFKLTSHCFIYLHLKEVHCR